MDESRLINEVRRLITEDPIGQLGVGDDACVWKPGGETCLSVDGMVEEKHFTSNTHPEEVGRKAAAAALSDIAAMGARPVGATVSLHTPSHWNGLAVMKGLLNELQRHNCHCYGGDTTGADQLVISVTVWGETVSGGRLVRRSEGQAGDILAVTGFLGGSFTSGRHLRPEPRFAEGQWLAQREGVNAMMDISDGLAADAPKLASASKCGNCLALHKIPIHDDLNNVANASERALVDGEDFELLCAIHPAHWDALHQAWPFDIPLHHVGELTAEAGNFIQDRDGNRTVSPYTGFEHSV